MNSKNFLNRLNTIILPTTILILFNQCFKSEKNPIPVQTYYYEFINFDTTDNTKKLYNDVKSLLLSGDYIISNHETLDKVEKGSVSSLDSLSKYHKLIHRIRLIDDAGKLKSGDIKLLIRYVPKTDTTGSAIEFSRYEYSNQDSWQLKYNFGSHNIVNFRDNYNKQIEVLAFEIARASFK